MADLRVHFGGLDLRNPLIAASGPITGNVDAASKLADAGIAAVVTKTSLIKTDFERWVSRSGIFPFKPVYKYQSLVEGRLLSLPTLSDMPVSEMAKRIEQMKKRHITVIASVMGLSVNSWVESAKTLENAGADAIECNFCCTIPEFTSIYKQTGENVSMHPKTYARIFKAVKSAVSIPVGAKSTVSLTVYAKVMEGLLRAKIGNSLPDFVTLAGQLDQCPGVDMQTLKPIIPHISTFGWQGDLRKLTYSALGTFSSSLGTENPMLSASGGIVDLEGVVNCLALGATTVQLHTVILDKGPRVITKILNGLNDYLDSQGISNVGGIIGVGARDFIPSLLIGTFMRERDSLFGTVYAKVDTEKCVGCKTCEKVCTENAVRVSDKKSFINKDNCRGCNLCVLKCPHGAIQLENYDRLEALIDSYKNSERSVSLKEFMKKEKIGLKDLVLLPGKLKHWGLR